MKKKLVGVSLIALFSITNGCASESNLASVQPPIQPIVEAPVSSPEQEANASSIFQPERPITKIVADIFSDFDHNKNGTIDYKSTATDYNDYYKANENNTYGNVQHTASFNNVPTRPYITVSTRTKLFVASDKNVDGTITTEELISFITEKFDENKDDILSSRGIAFWQDKNEYQLFNGEYKATFFKNMYV